MPSRLPWEIVETLPGTSAELLDGWATRLREAPDRETRARALVGHALASYWTVQTGVETEPWATVSARRAEAVDEALDLARRIARPDLLAEALLGQLHAHWGPDHVAERPAIVADMVAIHDDVDDEELRYQIRSWSVLGALDVGDLRSASAAVDRLAEESASTDLVLFPRRVRLWRANLAMLRGDIDHAVATNQAVLADTAPTAGAPFSFQNAMVTFAIERFFRKGLADVVDPVRSVRASSPRVSANWDAALAFSLAQSGQLDDAAAVFEPLAVDDFSAIHRDLNWLVVVVLLGLTALDLDDGPRISTLRRLLEPFAAYDATHGSGYASYGPVGRVVGMLAARSGDRDGARQHLGAVLVGREPGPWTSLARLELARSEAHRSEAHRPGDGRQRPAGDETTAAGPLADQAADDLRTLGLDGWEADARSIGRAARETSSTGPSARRVGSTWTLTHPTGEATVRHGRGVELLVQLLARPGAAIDAADLDGVDPTLPRRSTEEPLFDATARRAFRDRLALLEQRSRRRPTDDDEIVELRKALAGATHVPQGSAELERTRVRVTKALRRALVAVEEASPTLGAHLASSISTGRTCVYAPVDGNAWTVRAGDGAAPAAHR